MAPLALLVVTRIHASSSPLSPPPPLRSSNFQSLLTSLSLTLSECDSASTSPSPVQSKLDDLTNGRGVVIKGLICCDEYSVNNVKIGLEEGRQIGTQIHGTPEGAHPCDVLQVSPWGKFTPSLNASITHLTTYPPSPSSSTPTPRPADMILYVSSEVNVKGEDVCVMIEHLLDENEKSKCAVVGLACPGHSILPPPPFESQPERNVVERVISGVTCPWNTCAIWNNEILNSTGFAVVSEGRSTCENGQGWEGGVEECCTICLLSHLQGVRARVIVGLESMDWDTGDLEGERLEWHKRKMESKRERAEMQMKRLMGGKEKDIVVEHVYVNKDG